MMLWECAYAELVFTDRGWPDFGGDDLESAVREYAARERRFGGLGPSVERVHESSMNGGRAAE